MYSTQGPKSALAPAEVYGQKGPGLDHLNPPPPSKQAITQGWSPSSTYNQVSPNQQSIRSTLSQVGQSQGEEHLASSPPWVWARRGQGVGMVTIIHHPLNIRFHQPAVHTIHWDPSKGQELLDGDHPWVIALRPSPKDGHHHSLTLKFHRTGSSHDPYLLGWALIFARILRERGGGRNC